jgi:hypothetical protein
VLESCVLLGLTRRPTSERSSAARRERSATLWPQTQEGGASLDTLKRGKHEGGHQRLTVRDGAEQTFWGHWVGTFADSHPLPPPPRLPPSSSTAEDANLLDTTSARWTQDGATPRSRTLRTCSGTRPGVPLFVSGLPVTKKERSLQHKAPGEDGTPVSVFKGRFCSSEGAVDLRADTLSFLCDGLAGGGCRGGRQSVTKKGALAK